MASKKRLVISALIGFLSLSGLLGGFGFVSAGVEPDGPFPGEFTLPAPHVGDRGHFTVTVVRQGPLGLEILEPERMLFGFQWLEPAVRYDFDGVAHDVNRLHVSQFSAAGEHFYDPVLNLDVASGLAISQEYDSSVPAFAADGSTSGRDEAMRRDLMSLQPDGMPLYPCGLLSPLRGQTLSTDTPRVWYPQCNWEAYWASEKVFRAMGTERLGEHDTVLFSAQQVRVFGGSSAAHMWLSETIPYPLRIVVQDPDDDQVFHVLRLASYRAGTRPLDNEPHVGASLPPVRLAPRTTIGPDTTGFPMDFSLEDALAVAKGHDDAGDLRGYLRAHPDAQLERAAYEHIGDSQQWYFQYSDGAQSKAFYLTRAPRASGGGLGQILDLQDPAMEDRYQSVNPVEQSAPLAVWPDELPTVASLMARWPALAGPDYRSETINAWEFTIWCSRPQDDPCGAAAASVRVGFADADDQGRRRSTTSATLWDHDDSSWGVFEYADGDVVATASVPRSTGQSQVAEDATPMLLETSLWSFPDQPQAVGAAGLISALGAMLYYFWPVLKTGGATLFSRVTDPDQMLEHPVRRTMYDTIEQNPGIHVRRLRETMGTGRGATDHHLQKLEQVRLVTRVQDDGYSCLFIRGRVDRRLMAAAPALKAPGARRLLDAIHRAPGCGASDAGREAGLTAGTVNYHMKRLAEAGLVTVDREGARVRLFPTELALQAVA